MSSIDLLNEIDQTIALLEADIPANPGSAKNEKLEKRMQRDLARYFRQLNDAIDIEGLEKTYYRNVKQE